MLGDYERIVTSIAVTRKDTDHPGPVNARQVAHTIDNLLKECCSLLLEVLWLRQIDAHRENVVDTAAQIRRAEPLVTLEQQPRSNEQHHRESHFKGEKNLAQSRSTLAATERTRGLLEALQNSRARRVESWN